jgi:hypothetical protein
LSIGAVSIGWATDTAIRKASLAVVKSDIQQAGRRRDADQFRYHAGALHHGICTRVKRPS